MFGCPGCGTVRTGRFCEQCGHDFAAPGSGPTTPSRPRPPTGLDVTLPSGRTTGSARRWTAEIVADRSYFESVCWGHDGLVFPGPCPPRRVPLDGRKVRIGRRSATRGVTPEIDLSTEPADPGISH